MHSSGTIPLRRVSVLVIDADAAYIARELMAAVPTLDVSAAASADACEIDLSHVAGLISLGRLIGNPLIEKMPKLRWLQFLTSGTDKVAQLTSLSSDAVVTSAHGVHGPAVSEMAVAMMLALGRGLPSILENQRAHRWERRPQPLLCGKTVVVLGTGLIAQALAVRCRAFGMSTIGVSSSPRDIAGFDRVMARGELGSAARLADFFVVLVPLSADTRGLVNRSVFESMKPRAFFLNLARGPVCVEEDLLRALTSGRIAGAGLDVFEVEPLPADHALWDLPNVIATPHIAGESDRYADQVLPLLVANARSFGQNKFDEMLNVVRGPG
ncbi:D-2-hydroxyacid dehydrogenase [soil metagenome]